MGALALIAAAGAVLATGALSSAMDGGPDPAFATRTVRKVASARPGMEAHAANPPALAPAAASSRPPPPAGVWRIQAGAFRTRPAAEAQLRALKSEVPEVARLTAISQPGGGLNRVRIGGIENEAAARGLCARLTAVGRGCFVVGPES